MKLEDLLAHALRAEAEAQAKARRDRQTWGGSQPGYAKTLPKLLEVSGLSATATSAELAVVWERLHPESRAAIVSELQGILDGLSPDPPPRPQSYELKRVVAVWRDYLTTTTAPSMPSYDAWYRAQPEDVRNGLPSRRTVHNVVRDEKLPGESTVAALARLSLSL